MTEGRRPKAPGEVKLFKVTFNLEQERPGWPPVLVERLWAEVTPEKFKLRLANTPFFARGVSFGDLVIVHPDPDRGELVFDSRGSESGHSTVRVIVMDENLREEIELKIEEFGCSWEGVDQFKALLAVNIPSGVEYSPFREWLMARNGDGVLGFQESSISAVHQDRLRVE